MRLFAPLLLAALLLPVTAGAGGRTAERRAEARTEIAQLLRGGNPHSAVSRLRFLREQPYAAAELIRAWDGLERDEVRRNVATALAGLEVASSERLLVEFTTSTDPSIRMSGAQGLGRIRTRRFDALVPLLDDRSLAVRREAAKALGQARGNRAMGAVLVKAAAAEGEPEVRAAMLEAAGRSGNAKIAPAMAGFLDSSSEATRFAAARGLCLLGARQGFEFASGWLASEDTFVRRQGVALFEELPAKVAKPHLEPMLEDPDRRVAASAARILYQGGDDSKLEWLVLASHLSKSEDKLIIERELETLMLTDARRKAILRKAGVE